MKIRTAWAAPTLLGLGMLVGCTGTISDPGSASGSGGSEGTGSSGSGGGTAKPGSGGSAPSGSGGSAPTGSGGSSASGGSAPAGSGGSAPAGSGGSASTGSGGGAATGGSSGSGGAAPNNGTVPGALDLNGNPKYYRVVRLTNAQWARTIPTVLGVSANGMEEAFEGVATSSTDFSNNELVLDFSSRNWQDFQAAAETLATQVTATDAALAKIYSGTDAAGFIAALGRRTYRRPLTAGEKTSYMTLYNQGASLMGSRSAFAKGASLVIRAMLQSPYFLFRIEAGTKGTALDPYEMAAKLSLILRGAGPDDATLDQAAGAAKLDTADGAGRLANAMMGDATGTAMMRQFHGEWLHFDDYAHITKVGVSEFNDALPAEYQEASYRFFDDVF
ncbi:MAG TPA: DUF1595 domain-containing protein, partial [Polyangia bacterium]|nr:DUF1595 domain-containing protein [Polyangia bacterium]